MGIDKIYEKSYPVMHTYNDEKKSFTLIYLPKILRVSQDIGSCPIAIIQDNDNDNIRFYLRNIIQVYIKITLDLNSNFYIQLFSKLILQLNA